MDPTFLRNWNEAQKYEISRSAYHFFTTFDPPQSQASNIATTLKKVNFQPGYNGLVIDVEGDSCLVEVDTMSRNVLSLITLLEEMYNFPVFIYTRANYWNACINTTWNNVWLKRPLWVAYYSDTAKQPVLPKPWSSSGTWVLWQYSQTCRMPGIKGNVDLSYLNPNLTDMSQFGKNVAVKSTSSNLFQPANIYLLINLLNSMYKTLIIM